MINKPNEEEHNESGYSGEADCCSVMKAIDVPA